jgi:electron transport complex protein RnfE
MSVVKEFTKGFWEVLPPFRLVLGLCPTLAVTTSAVSGFGMGIAATFVLVCSNVLISLLRNFIPKKVRIAAYIVIIASFVTIVDLMLQGYVYALSKVLGVFIPLIVVNCIILGRAEAFAGKNGPLASLADGLGVGLGFTMSLTIVGSLREIIGSGVWLKFKDIFELSFDGIQFFSEPMGVIGAAPGAFISLGILLAIINVISTRMEAKKG